MLQIDVIFENLSVFDQFSWSVVVCTYFHLLVQLQRQHILLSYFKTLSVGPVWGSNPRPPAQQTGALPTELTRRRLYTTKNTIK